MIEGSFECLLALISFGLTFLLCKPLGWFRESGLGRSRDIKLSWNAVTQSWVRGVLYKRVVRAHGAARSCQAACPGWDLLQIRVAAGAEPAIAQGGCAPCLFTGISSELGFERGMLSRSLAVSCSPPSPNPSILPRAIRKQYWSWILDKLEIFYKLHFVERKKSRWGKKWGLKKGAILSLQMK